MNRIDAYLAELNTALATLPAAEREDIAREIAGHLRDRATAGGLDAALKAMGAPEAYARSFLEDRSLSQALVRPNPLMLLFAVLNRAARSVLAFVFGTLAAALYLFAAAFALIVVLKEITPGNVGWWAGHGHFEFGAIFGSVHPGPERLGYWIIPIAAGGAVCCYILATELLRLVGRTLVKRRAGMP
jgi:hypothetical protein